MLHPSYNPRSQALTVLGMLLIFAAAPGCGGGGSSGGGTGTQASTSWVHHWNHVAIDASGLDHTPVASGDTRVFGEQLGPTRASRAMAIVHIAVFEAVNAIARLARVGPSCSPKTRVSPDATGVWSSPLASIATWFQ